MTWEAVLYLISCACFVLAFFAVWYRPGTDARVIPFFSWNWIAAGLFFFVLVDFVHSIQH